MIPMKGTVALHFELDSAFLWALRDHDHVLGKALLFPCQFFTGTNHDLHGYLV